MTNDLALYMSRQLLSTAMLISAPVVLIALITGLVLSILQVVTQLQDSTLNFVPKLLAVILVLMFASGWMLQTLIEYTQGVFTRIPEMVQS